MAERKKFLLRLDPKLWEELAAWADQELRSVNGQIEFILREAVNRRKRRLTGEPERQGDDSAVCEDRPE